MGISDYVITEILNDERSLDYLVGLKIGIELRDDVSQKMKEMYYDLIESRIEEIRKK